MAEEKEVALGCFILHKSTNSRLCNDGLVFYYRPDAGICLTSFWHVICTIFHLMQMLQP